MPKTIDNSTRHSDRPLTRADVEELLQRAGSSQKLSLQNQNLRDIDLSGFDLRGTNFSGATFSKANLSGAILSGADLTEANLSDAQLSGEYLTGAFHPGAPLAGTILAGANLTRANLTRANLSGTILIKADLSGTILAGANLTRANLSGANLDRVTLTGALLSHVTLDQQETVAEKYGYSSDIHIRVDEEPLRLQNLSHTLSNLVELYTKFYLIQQNRLQDFITYIETKERQFEDEVSMNITAVTFNSPINFKVDISPKGLAEAVQTFMDALLLRKHRVRSAELDNQKKELEVEKQRLENTSFAWDLAYKTIERLCPNADENTKLTFIKGVFSNISVLEASPGLQVLSLSTTLPNNIAMPQVTLANMSSTVPEPADEKESV